MKNKERINGNILIAKFMGFRQENDSMVKYAKVTASGKVKPRIEIPIKSLNYHTSLESSMAVLEDVNELYPYLVSHKTCTIYRRWMKESVVHNHGKTTIEAVWLSLVQFVKFYNEKYGERYILHGKR